MKRHKEAGEKEKEKAPTILAPKEGKLSKVGTKMSYRICGQQGHNKIGCPITKAKKAAEAGEGTSSGAATKKRQRNEVKRALVPKGCTNVKDQVIKSTKTWVKVKQSMENTSGPNVRASTSQKTQQPPTQSSQNPAAMSGKMKTSEPMQPS
ncbi:hypothetical protein ACLB2K_070949 [Fragaria x ananassa]